MSITSSFKKVFYIDYGALNQEDKAHVYHEFIEESITRINLISAIAFIGEVIITLLDFLGGFFSQHPLNYLNLIGELIIVVASLMVNVLCNTYAKKDFPNQRARRNLLFFYKLAIFVAISLFIATDILVRQKTIGAYLVFLFVFLVIPFYKARENLIVYAIIIALIAILSLGFAQNMEAGSLFSVTTIILSFAFATECLRSYSIRTSINNRMNELMTVRFSRLASQTIMALSNAVEAKDLYTKGHSQRVANYSKEIARRMGYSEEQLDDIYYIGLLHDIGKLGVGDAVINKTGRLTDEEFAEIKRHPEIGYDILKIITEIPDISIGARYHHERVNGGGYPEGLRGDEIPEIAKIIAVADAYDAMTSNRSYREVMPQQKVRGEIERNAGTQFAPEVARIMLQMIDEDVAYTMHA